MTTTLSPDEVLWQLLLLVDTNVEYCIENIIGYTKHSNLSAAISVKLPVGRVTANDFRALLFATKLLKYECRYSKWSIDSSKFSSLLSVHHMTVSTSEDKPTLKKKRTRVKKMSVLANNTPIEACDYPACLQVIRSLVKEYAKAVRKYDCQQPEHSPRPSTRQRRDDQNDDELDQNEESCPPPNDDNGNTNDDHSTSCPTENVPTVTPMKAISDDDNSSEDYDTNMDDATTVLPMTNIDDSKDTKPCFPDRVEQLIQDAEALDFDATPRIAMNSNKIIRYTAHNKRTISDAMKMMIIYIAIHCLGYKRTSQSSKASHRILGAARRLVYYAEGYPAPIGDHPRQLERYIISLDEYCAFDGTGLPIDVSIPKEKSTKVERIMRMHPRLLLASFREAGRSIGKKASYTRLAESMTKLLHRSAPDTQSFRLTRHDFGEFFKLSVGKLKRESFKPRLTEEKKEKRVYWMKTKKRYLLNPLTIAIGILTWIVSIHFWMRTCWIDEKWFYHSSGRCMMKEIPQQNGKLMKTLTYLILQHAHEDS